MLTVLGLVVCGLVDIRGLMALFSSSRFPHVWSQKSNNFTSVMLEYANDI